MNALETITKEIRACTACDLHETRSQAVPGSGTSDAQIVFIGEAPGAQEDKRGLPFVGQAGKLLDQLLEGIGLDRDRVAILNVIKCRPPDNRPPRKSEIAACRHFLERQLDAIQPQLIVTLGRFSLVQFCPDVSITQVHGQVQRVDGRLIYPVYHPAAAFHRSVWRQALEKDFGRISEILASLQK
ncbi:MAG: uracil-DNA glycosylase family protein [Anaerolineae bacterium]